MARRRRIPGMLDVLTASDPAEIALLVEDRRLDRGPAEGPFLNRLIYGRARRLLRVGTTPFPTMVSRWDQERQHDQADLAAHLGDVAAGVGAFPEEDLAAIVAYVRGGSDRRAAGIAIQTLFGRLFVPDYRGDDASFAAAELVNASLGSRNPLRWLIDRLTGRVERARDRLAQRVNGHPVALHVTMVALHNLVVTAERMRTLYATRGERSISPEDALALCFAAPPTVLRQAIRPADTIAGPVAKGTLVTLNLREASDGQLTPGATLLEGHWSQCPASLYLRSVVKEIWRRAKQEGGA
ncbi:hypothetical protein [Rhizobium sp. BK251]|uniref:hypothetical protein n=1 Tax=Rhizobium sp. BK251 TaxID=2512125 RepID=UPI00104AE723|nr:hypothetical protein [Rhizobium sp. BK251]TCL75689.1 hypothetical protein EV286_101232 [Rhizobium sp. BK251]